MKFMIKKRIQKFSIYFAIIVFFVISFFTRRVPHIRYAEIENALQRTEAAYNPYSELSVPTQITKIGDTYFLVDCYHNQVLYSDSLDAPLYDWLVMTNDMNRGHTIASDGVVYLIDDTENNRILIFEKKEDSFIHTQTLNDIGIRPHYIIYHQDSQTFYAWSSVTGEMYLLRRDADSTRVFLSQVKQIPSLNGVYVRSFTIEDDFLYLVSGNGSILKLDLISFKQLEEYPVPDELYGMIQLTPIDGYYYITVSTDKSGDQDAATIIRTKDLQSLSRRDYEDVYDSFIGGGTPYYISYFDDTYYMTEHRIPGHSVWSFRSINGELTDINTVY